MDLHNPQRGPSIITPVELLNSRNRIVITTLGLVTGPAHFIHIKTVNDSLSSAYYHTERLD